MKKILTRGRLALIGVIAAIGAIAGVGLIAPANAYVTDNDQLVYASVLRQGNTTLTAANGSYTNLTADASKWNLDEDGGFTLTNDGLTVPVDGVYQLNWSVMLQSGGTGIIGFVLDDQTPNGGILLGQNGIVNTAAAIGSGSQAIWLAAGTHVDLWGYGAGSSISLQTASSTRFSVVLLQEDLPPA